MPSTRAVAVDPPTVRLDDVHLAYDDSPLFEQLELTLPAGSWTCLLGRSGCGKSTLLRLIAGLATGGESRFTLSTDDQSPLRHRIAWMAQQDLLLPWSRVIDNVTLGSRLRGQTTDRERAHELLAAVGLTHAAQRRPEALSGGQRSRIALARTLYEGASVVLMDEPFASLDAITRLELHELAARLLAGRTVIMVTHDPAEALRLADRLLVMHGLPATLSLHEAPSGTPPRDIHDAELITHQRQLLDLLNEQTAPTDIAVGQQ
ncbi:putative hydroxymethylpyrimidine transport system ATP-binding protein [Kushneria sinocarnis]|uniref:Putative hydroxymethylpyrimidine transport system ATP-binding protein n=1 Tax=Kushneria sinocarnis TaxID=595502 RepID=A0A420WYD0_9GAMM|nr:ABC transporter ATP-binding protein [Kushneria sinocarnis]RKR06234.1 putative hydroxymethylpyrimidine transport system ATP-binding protein [Kushneria sinocarnis]